MVEGSAFSLVKGCYSSFQPQWNPFSQSYGPLKHLGNRMLDLSSLRPHLLFLCGDRSSWCSRRNGAGTVLFRVPILLCRNSLCTSVWWQQSSRVTSLWMPRGWCIWHLLLLLLSKRVGFEFSGAKNSLERVGELYRKLVDDLRCREHYAVTYFEREQKQLMQME